MPFLTQGKTNWKFLLIVVVLTVIVGGGIWWFAEQQKAVTIRLSQEERGERIEEIENGIDGKKCFTNDDCVTFGYYKDCNSGCFNKNYDWEKAEVNCYSYPPVYCECIDGQCEEVLFKENSPIFLDFTYEEKDEETGWNIYRNGDYKVEFIKPEEYSEIEIAVIPACNYANLPLQGDCPIGYDLIFTFQSEGCESESCLMAVKHNLFSSYATNGPSQGPLGEETTINKAPFCLYEYYLGAAMGRYGSEYYYVTVKNKDCFIIKSTQIMRNCGHFFYESTEELKECEEDERNKIETNEKVISTFKFSN
jgi:hypothetical protein